MIDRATWPICPTQKALCMLTPSCSNLTLTALLVNGTRSTEPAA